MVERGHLTCTLPLAESVDFVVLRVSNHGLRGQHSHFLSWRPLWRLFGRQHKGLSAESVREILCTSAKRVTKGGSTEVFPAFGDATDDFVQEGRLIFPEEHTKTEWFLSVQATAHLVMRFVVLHQKPLDVTRGCDFLAWLLSEKCHLRFSASEPTSDRRSFRTSNSLADRRDEPMTPVLSERSSVVPSAPCIKRFRVVSTDVDQPLTPIGPARPEVPIFVAATYPASPDAVAPADADLPLAVPKRLISRELDDVADANSSIPVKKSLGSVVEVAFEFLYPGKFALQQRLEAAGHMLEPEKHGATRGPWRILFRALGRDQVNLRLHKRLSEGILCVDFGRKGEKCCATLTMQEHIVQSVVDVIRRPRSVHPNLHPVLQ